MKTYLVMAFINVEANNPQEAINAAEKLADQAVKLGISSLSVSDEVFPGEEG